MIGHRDEFDSAVRSSIRKDAARWRSSFGRKHNAVAGPREGALCHSKRAASFSGKETSGEEC